jgi:DNA-binding response OmpR family regulator
MRLLLVEDEEDLVATIRPVLVREGYAVDAAGGMEAAREKLACNTYDVMVLDLNLPDGDGYELCLALRRNELETPAGPDLRVLMLTARDGLGDRVRGLNDGADDYLVNPFALAELLARLRALLRRDAGGAPAALRVGELTLDGTRFEAYRGQRHLSLTRKEFGVLEYLMTSPGEVVPVRELQRNVWDEHADPITETVRVTVGTLRRKLSDHGEPVIVETVPGKGYRLKVVA